MIRSVKSKLKLVDGLRGRKGGAGVKHSEISAALSEILSLLAPLHMRSRIAGFPLLEKTYLCFH